MKKYLNYYNIKRIDDWVVFAGAVYVILPILIFLMKFTRPIYFAIGLFMFVYLLFHITKTTSEASNGFDNPEILNRRTVIYLIATTVVFIIWTYYSGIGSYTYQNWDFWVRNPIYNDLINKSWPLYYNLGDQSEAVRGLIGGEWVAFAYYFTYWLTPASICKVLHLSYHGCQFVLFAYSLIGILIINYLLSRLFRRFSYLITSILIGFSGLDFLAFVIKNHALPWVDNDLEWALQYFQLSGNTTQIYFVFNQSIPIWIILLLILNLNSPALMAAIGSICFAYSPWATIGLVPIIIIGMLYKTKPEDRFSDVIRRCISICNIIIPLFLLIVYGLYYSASSGSEGSHGLYAQAVGADTKEYIYFYILYILTEFLLYYLAVGKKIFRYRYSLIILIEMTLYPIYHIVDYNFFIRGTIPALFIFMIILISYLTGFTPEGITKNAGADSHTEENANAGSSSKASKSYRVRKVVLAALLAIGALTSVLTFTKSIVHTYSGDYYLQSDIFSFDDMQGANEYQTLTVNTQFFVHGFATKPFYLYISKLGL